MLHGIVRLITWTHIAPRRTSIKKDKGSPYSIPERTVPELIPVFGSQPADDVSHKPGSRLPLLSARPAVTPATLKRAATNFAAWWTEARWVWTVCLTKTVIQQHCDCDLNPGPTAPESSTLTTRLPSHCLLPARKLQECHCSPADIWTQTECKWSWAHLTKCLSAENTTQIWPKRNGCFACHNSHL